MKQQVLHGIKNQSINQLIIESIKDLTYINDPSKIQNKDEYIQILEITLKDKSKENVLKYIEELWKLDFIQIVEPVYYMQVAYCED